MKTHRRPWLLCEVSHATKRSSWMLREICARQLMLLLLHLLYDGRSSLPLSHHKHSRCVAVPGVRACGSKSKPSF